MSRLRAAAFSRAWTIPSTARRTTAAPTVAFSRASPAVSEAWAAFLATSRTVALISPMEATVSAKRSDWLAAPWVAWAIRPASSPDASVSTAATWVSLSAARCMPSRRAASACWRNNSASSMAARAFWASFSVSSPLLTTEAIFSLSAASMRTRASASSPSSSRRLAPMSSVACMSPSATERAKATPFLSGPTIDRVRTTHNATVATMDTAATTSRVKPRARARSRAAADKALTSPRLCASRAFTASDALRMESMDVPMESVKALLRLFWETSVTTCSLVLRHWAKAALKVAHWAASSPPDGATPSTSAAPASTKARACSRRPRCRSNSLEWPIPAQGCALGRLGGQQPFLDLAKPGHPGKVVSDHGGQGLAVSRMLQKPRLPMNNATRE